MGCAGRAHCPVLPRRSYRAVTIFFADDAAHPLQRARRKKQQSEPTLCNEKVLPNKQKKAAQGRKIDVPTLHHKISAVSVMQIKIP
jgi:hypothetical protein